MMMDGYNDVVQVRNKAAIQSAVEPTFRLATTIDSDLPRP